MTHIVQWAQNEQLTLDDLNDVGLSSRATFDFLTADAVDSSLKFAAFPIAETSLTSVTVGSGRLYQAGKMFSNEDGGGDVINLINYLPSVNGNTKIVSIVAFGTQQDTNSVPRTFLTNSATGITEANNVSTQNQRLATVAPSPGVEAPSPVAPPVSSSQCEIARIVLGINGIVSITYVEANRLQTVTGLDARTTSLESWRVQTGARIDTLGTDITNLANQIVGLPNPAIFSQIVHTLAQVQVKAKIPANALNFHLDNFLSQADSASDATQAAFLCRVQEGIRFPWAAQNQSYLSLFNPLEPKVKSGSGTALMLPDYVERSRIDTMGNDGNISLAQSQFQNLTAVQKSISRQVINFGTSFTVCVNSVWWSQGQYDPITGIFTRDGETYQVVDTLVSGYAGLASHEIVRLNQFWTSTMTDTYTDYLTTTTTVSGSTKSQTFLNSQAGWLISMDFAFSAVAATGDVTLLVVNTTNGAPDFTSVIAQVKVPVGRINTYPAVTNFPLKPTYLDAGQRYAAVIVSPGNHFICYVSGNKYAQGSLFDSTDGSWSQGDLTKDLAFRANFASFTSTICQVQLTPLQLQNGITDISLIYGSKIPAGCELIWEIQKNGLWYAMQSYGSGNNPLLGLPPLLPLRVTFVGTTDLMPGIDMAQTETLVSRPGAAFQHYTPNIAIGSPSSNIKVEVTVDYFNPLNHTNGCNLLIGGGSVPFSTVTTVADPTDPSRFIKTYTFALGAPTSNFVIGINGTTNTVASVYHVECRYDYES
jgi:hypothetical protein